VVCLSWHTKIVECFPGTTVEACGDNVEVVLVQPSEGTAPVQVLAQQAVGGLIATPLPGRVWVGEEDANAGLRGQADAVVSRCG